mgnify:FL=1
MIREIKSMNYANDSDFGNIMSIVYKHRDWLGHIRTDYIRQTIINNAKAFNFDTNFASKSPTTNLLIFENDVIISYNIYKRKQKLNKPYYNKETNKVIEAQPGDCILHQIVAKVRNGSAKTVFNKFLRYINTRVFLTVRSENMIAKRFYEKNGMSRIGGTSWSKGSIPGDIYLYDSN